MKNFFILIFLVMFSMTALPQRFVVKTTDLTDFKRHFTYSIEGGFVDNLPRQFIAGNKSDFF